jgi:hypothetical protein
MLKELFVTAATATIVSVRLAGLAWADPPVHSALSRHVLRRATWGNVPLMAPSRRRRACSSAVLRSSHCMRGTMPIAELDPTPSRSFRHDREGETTMNTRPATTDERPMRNGHRRPA